jgi:hypothetical protein
MRSVVEEAGALAEGTRRIAASVSALAGLACGH